MDVTLRAVAGTLSSRVRIATTQVPAVGALHLVSTHAWDGEIEMSASKLHGCEGAAVSVTALSSFRSAIARAVWSKKLPMTNTLALLSLLDCPWGSDPAFFIIWSRFRQHRRYLAYPPDEEARIFRLLDFASTGSPGHGPIHFLIQSAEELVFFWDSEQAGWIQPGLPPLRMIAGPVQHFRIAIWQAWQSKVATDLCKRKGFRCGFGVDLYGSHQLLVSSHLRERDKCCFEPFFQGESGMASCSVKLRKKTFLVGFVVCLTMMVIFFFGLHFSPFF